MQIALLGVFAEVVIERALNIDWMRVMAFYKIAVIAIPKAHIEVQRWIDEGGLLGRENAAASISEIHARFTRLLPDELRWVENPDTLERIPVVPGEMRTRDAQVGTHIAVSPGALPRFMRRFEERYADLANFEAILAVGPAHHRLLYIHPFADGNGRVTRLAHTYPLSSGQLCLI